MRRLGIDEAGRGCVLGDLVVGAFVTTASDTELLAAGAADSKRLSPRRRHQAREALQSLGSADVRCITPAEIDEGNLNALEERAIVSLIIAWEPDVVVIDALGHPAGIPSVLQRIQAALPAGLRPALRMEPKADANHAVVGAASVIAKTTRDDALDAWRTSHDLGSGYPSDPATRRWLAEHASSGAPWPPFVRTRWQTVRDLAAKSGA